MISIATKPFSVSLLCALNRPNDEIVWERMNETSEHLTQVQLIPAVGDWVSVLKPDWPLLGLDADRPDDRSILIVTHRIINFGLYDVGVVCRIKDEPYKDQPLPKQWQQIPLN